MEFEKILKKIQKKQRMLLKVLASRVVEPSDDPYLGVIVYGLSGLGLVDYEQFTLTSRGREFIAAYEKVLFSDISFNDEVILDKLLRRKKVRTVRAKSSTAPKVKKVERLFLIFLSSGSVDRSRIRGGKHLIPRLRDRAYLQGTEEIGLTDLGRDVLGDAVSTEEEVEARKRFFAIERVDNRADLLNKSERFQSLYKNGFTYQEIGDLHEITRERVRQILNMAPNFSEFLRQHKDAKSQRKIEEQIERENNRQLRKSEKTLANLYPDRVRELWDNEKNVGLDPTMIGAGSASVEIWWKCPRDGHSWKKRPCDIIVSWWRSKTSGCPRCAGKTRKAEKQGKLSSVYPDLVNSYWDFERNLAEGLDPNELTLGSNWRAWFKCPTDGYLWKTQIHSIVMQQWSRGKTGCRVCSGTIHRKAGKWGKAGALSLKFPDEIAMLWDFGRNGDLGFKPDEITVGSSREAWFCCAAYGHRWKAKIAAICRSWQNGRTGCPACYRLSHAKNDDR